MSCNLDVILAVDPGRQFPQEILVDEANWITCADGFRLSVITGRGTYSRRPVNSTSYIEVEVGFPSERPEPWEKWGAWAEDAESPNETVYSYVPVWAVRELITLHGGCCR